MERYRCTMVENRKKHKQNSHPIIHFPTSQGVSQVSEQASGASGRAVRASEWTSEWTSEWPHYCSLFLAVLHHSAMTLGALFASL